MFGSFLSYIISYDDSAVKSRPGRVRTPPGHHGRTGRRAPAARPGRPGRGASRKELSRCFLVRIPAWIFLGAWFLYQLIEANFGLFNAHANAGGVAFFAHVGGFVFGLLTARLLARAGQAAPRKQWPSTA